MRLCSPFVAAIVLASGAGVQASGARGAAPQSAFEQGVEAYRRGAYGEARERWRSALEEELAPRERARVWYDLGNAAWRLEKPLEAIVCYTAAVRLDPRHAGARGNLELARAKAGLVPEDGGGPLAVLERVASALGPAGRRGLALGALALWTLLLLLEMRLGGAWLARSLALGAIAVVLAALPWIHGLLRPPPVSSLFVVQSSPLALRSEPLEGREPIAELAPLEEVRQVDALPGWTRVERADGMRGWARAETLFLVPLDGESGAPGAAGAVLPDRQE